MPLDLHSNPLFRKLESGRSLQTRKEQHVAPSWSLEGLAGHMVELDGGVTMAAALLHSAQCREEPSAWVGARQRMFFPPDLAACGIDLASLPVIRARGEAEMWKATLTLLRSGAFSLLILSPEDGWRMPETVQTLLQRHASEQGAVLLHLRPEGAAPPARNALRARTVTQQLAFDRFRVTLSIQPANKGGAAWSTHLDYNGIEGLV